MILLHERRFHGLLEYLVVDSPEIRFVDANIFINWLKATPTTALRDEAAALSGFILHRIESGEEAFTTLTIKDEVSIWLSRYRAEALI